jgi:hypothetical protein
MQPVMTVLWNILHNDPEQLEFLLNQNNVAFDVWDMLSISLSNLSFGDAILLPSTITFLRSTMMRKRLGTRGSGEDMGHWESYTTAYGTL